MKRLVLLFFLTLLSAGGAAPARAQDLGPRDGRDLPPTDLNRVAVGQPAPDFILTNLDGGSVQLSSFRDKTIVVLVFFRGQW